MNDDPDRDVDIVSNCTVERPTDYDASHKVAKCAAARPQPRSGLMSFSHDVPRVVPPVPFDELRGGALGGTTQGWRAQSLWDCPSPGPPVRGEGE
jgi:hypothetical protein